MERRYSDDIVQIMGILREFVGVCSNACDKLYEINKQLYREQTMMHEIQHECNLDYFNFTLEESTRLIDEVMKKLLEASGEADSCRIHIEKEYYIPIPPPGTFGSELPAQKLKS